jgi:hypothetical protein
MPAARAAGCAMLLTVVGLTLTGCGDNVQPGDTRTGTPSTSPSRTNSSPHQEDEMKIQITIGNQRFQATIFDSAAGRDLIAQLPLTIDMTDHGSVEKTGHLPAPLSLDGQPDGADPDVADVGYYAPGNDLVFYYGDQSYYPGIVIIGRLDGDAASRIADMKGAITATVQAQGG